MADNDTPSEDLETQKPESLGDSLNASELSNSAQGGSSLETETPEPSSSPEIPNPEPKKKNSHFSRFRQSLNIYLLLLGAVLLMAVAIIGVVYKQSHSSSGGKGPQTQNLTQATLDQLANSNSTVGSSQYVLNVESSAIFAGQVVMKQSLEVAGNLQVGGTLSLNNLSVAGTGQFSQVTTSSNLSVGGNSAVQGSTTISKTLQVGGGGTFGGTVSAPQITTTSLQLVGDLTLQHHIVTSGPTPSRSNGSGLGGGGSASISGSDTAGSININTGNSPPAGCFVTVNFSTPFSTTPYILVTPVGSAAGGLSYYVNRSTTNFSICDASPAPSGSSFGFDYFVID